MKIRTSAAISAVAGASALALLLAGCSTGGTPASTSSAPASSGPLAAVAACTSSQTSADTFALGTFLPLTGQLAFLGAAAVSGSGEALSEINAAGGVNGKDACVLSTDSGDGTTLQTIGEPNAQKLIAAKVSAILGAESSGVTLDVLPTVDAAGIVMFSPANTSDALTGASKWFFRDPVPNSVEGEALGSQIVADGNTNVAILVASEAYTTNLRDGIAKSLESNGATVVYGKAGANQEFSQTESNFGPIVQAALATKPDAIVIDAEDQTKQILPALASAGFDLSKTYFVDGNLNDWGDLASQGVNLKGAKGTSQGISASEDFHTLLNDWYKKNVDPKGFTTMTYGAEAYDATIILALAAQIAGSNQPADFAKYILPLTGAQDGFTANGTTPTVTALTGQTECKTYADCLALVKGGNKNIKYVGVSGFGPLNTGHDPSSGYVTVYQYDEKNAPSTVLDSINSAK